jgi:hypothetical protein
MDLNKKVVIIVSVCIFIFLMVSNFGRYASEQVVKLPVEGKVVEVAQIGKNIIFGDDESTIIGTQIMVEGSNKYAYVLGNLDNVASEFIFDIENEKLINSNEYKNVNNTYKDYEVIDSADGNIMIINKVTGELVINVDLIKMGYFEDIIDINLVKEWSRTKKYLLVSDLSSNFNVLINIVNGEIISIPIETLGVVEWSPNDEKVILYHMLESYNDPNTYLWDMKTGDIQKIAGFINRPLFWTPDGECIYYFDNYNENGTNGDKIVRYEIKNKVWEDIYKTLGSIAEDSLKWISNDQLIFTEMRTPKTLNPLRALLKPQDYYAVKVDIKKQSQKVRKLHAVLAKDYVWSYDNEYLYYIDQRGFFKAKVNFD